MAFTPFRNLDAVTVQGRRSVNTGRVSASQTPGLQFQIKYSYQVDASELTFSTGDLIIRTVGADFLMSDAAGVALLAFGFRTRYEIGQDNFGFVWTAVATTLTTTLPVPPPALLGDPNGIDLVGGGTAPAGADIIQDAWESPIFVFPVPSGATIKITFHSAGFPYLADILGLQVRTRAGGAAWASGFRHGTDGALVALTSGAGGQALRANGRRRTLPPPSPLGWGNDTPVYACRSQGAQGIFAVYGRAGAAYCRASRNEGATWGAEMLAYAGYTPVGAAQSGDGLIVLLTNAAGAAFAGRRSRLGGWLPPIPCALPSGVKVGTGALIATTGSGSLDFVWEGPAGTMHLHSANGGATWT